LFGRALLLISADEIAEIAAEERRIFLNDDGSSAGGG